MELEEAIEKMFSVRSYLKKPVAVIPLGYGDAELVEKERKERWLEL